MNGRYSTRKSRASTQLGIVVALLALLTGASSAFALGSVFKSIKAESKSGEITIEWSTNGQGTFQTFEVERRSNEVPTYRRIGKIIANGSHSYTFVDDGAYFRTNADKEFTYRIKAVGQGGIEQYSPPVTVSHKVVSSVKRSWGMIKELFR